VAALSRYLPNALAPEGQVSLELELKTGRQLQGFFSLTNAGTRPVGNLTPLRDISAHVRLDGTHATLEDFRGQIGGQPVRATGFVTFPDPEHLDYQLNLQGTNVPLARSLEFLLRGDFNVQLRGSNNLPPLVSGTVNLRDGLYLQHASALVWSGPKRPELRPPYFSVTNEPFADWRTDLSISGDRFLRVRTPIFSGLASAALKLKGTLRAPVLTGDARVNSGRLLFPFGTLNVNHGSASFSGNDAQGPDLQINAAGRNYRYDVQLDVKGPAADAQVTFSSTPPLTSEAILLMLTAGEMPHSRFEFSSEARAGRLATFLGKDLLSRYLGSDQGEERLIIRTGENVSEEGRLTYSVEYRLTDRWSIIGEYDEFNAFNTDLKWKVFTR
jgi:translocation and assembly module TamB